MAKQVEKASISIFLDPNKVVYFASDQHFGAPNRKESLTREKVFLTFLDQIEKDAQCLFLMGDLFDFWYEYKTVVPKGFVKILAKLSILIEKGIPIYFFPGNHDMWIKDYFQKEIGMTTIEGSQRFEIAGKTFLLAHGDGLGPDDKNYKRMKKVFQSPFFRWLFSWLHPDLGIPLGNYLSRENKMISGEEDAKFLGQDKEWLVQYCKRKLSENHYDYFVFGHRHLPLEIELGNSKYINLGDWIKYYTYATFSLEKGISLKTFQK
ncbi:MAG: UDP-2,3-diacylglucosamine hydrolase [Flavobacteriaceae bacterium]|nr:MAG: UDP-2,3-diacylglucosamine hydrolase [Flavobacteriaceae bacterium]